MEEFHFSKTYFNKLIFNDEDSKIRILVNEIPSFNISEEEYSLRVETRHEEAPPVHRKYAIEHHTNIPKHSFPHLQFKFHTEEIGTFRIRLDFNNSEEYKKAILGFIYKIKEVLENLEKHKTGIVNEILVLDLVNQLSKESEFLTGKIFESLDKYGLELDDSDKGRKVKRLENNPLLIGFLGKDNIRKIIELY